MPRAWREVRVFISSTFKDMQAERDHLVRFVFPRLREELLKRRVHFVDVDLRWGVTADQDAFDLCMREIKHCRPRFLCMLGGRYGWVPPPKTIDRAFLDEVLAGTSEAGALDDGQKETFEKLYNLDEAEGIYRLGEKPQSRDEVEAWNDLGNQAVDILQKAGLPEAESSITASEVLFGALDRLDKPTYRYFYFRDSKATESIPEPHASKTYREPAGSIAEEELEQLKARVKDEEGLMQTAQGHVEKVELPVYEYPCRWDEATERIVGLGDFGERIYQDLLTSIEAELGTEAPGELDLFEEENAVLEAEIERHTERYVVGERAPLLEAMLEHAEGSGGNPYFLVAGAPGSGKSALTCKFLSDYLGTEAQPVHSDQVVVPHLVGPNPTNIRELLQRLCHELVERAGLAEEVPADYEELRKAFPELLEKAAEERQVVLVIDAVNQLDPTQGAWSMTWLPDALPENARVILSGIDPSPAVDALRRRREPPGEEVLEPLGPDDATAIINGFLERYRKTMDDKQRELLLAKKDAGAPLYLLTALEELRTLGIYEEIVERIKELPGEVKPLFKWIFERLENDPGFRDAGGDAVGKQIVGPYCTYLGLGRSGMAQSELVGLIAPGDNGDTADPQGNLAALRALLLPYLMRRGELLRFYHDQTKEAVEESYLPDDEARVEAQRAIAGYFESQLDPDGDGSCKGDSLRGLSELPYHQTEATEWQKVYETLTNFPFLERKVSEVGVIDTTDAEGNTSKLYTGVLKLQDDYDHALSKMPGASAAARAKRPIILTATDFGDGYVIRCPFCNTMVPFQEEWHDTTMSCPEEGCGGPWKINPFKCERPSWAKKKEE